ncbi:hypothetical protein FOMPIDRAFT_1037053 [Fomitopsis schrenkii]|uniref:ubiquitinyl hydrolase 1 n=1 Tax=Fomitopsis schrenkii TaxID=2126942 RepID=S8FCN2_FOMSC|nr:hypothetical protein FOMPIDRAFT_1037053 [Fomitopsis schrenkii]
MAIGKWISFGNSPSAAAAPVVVPAQPPIVSSADAKHYANSVLQALYFCGPFRDLLVQYPDPSAPELPTSPPSPPAAPLPPAAQPQPAASTARRRLDRKYSVSETAAAPSGSHSTSPLNRHATCVIPPHPPTLLSALRSLFLHISKNPAERGTVAPRAFIDKLKELNELFRGSMHQDAHEFLNFLLNKIVEEMDADRRNGVGVWRAQAAANGNGHAVPNGSATGSTLNGEDLSSSIATLSTTAAGPSSAASKTSQPSGTPLQTTLVHRLFEGVLTSETRCLTCETVSSRDECFLDLSIDIEQNSSVTACLRQFSASEMLCQKNKFFCDSCCDLQEAEKRMKIKKLPNILALHLKRFKYQEDVGKYIKLAYRVAFPLELRLFNTVDDADNPDRLYELFAIVVHIGNGPHHGHYVTIIKARGTWLLFDDDSVDVIKESDIPRYYGESTNGSAYVLYYQAVDVDMAALGLKSAEPAPSPTDMASAPAAKPANSLAMSAAGSSEIDLSSPPLPPGLTEDSSERSQSSSPLPVTPASQPIPLAAGQSQSTKGSGGSIPPLTIPSQPQSVSGPSTPVQSTSQGSSSSSAIGGLFSTLRHSRSDRAADIRKSWLNVDAAQVPPVPLVPSPVAPPRRPATAASTASTAEGYESPSEPGSPALPYNGSANGSSGTSIGKNPEKKVGWFKRKSSRLEVSFSGAGPSAPEASSHRRSQTVKEGGSSRRLSASASASVSASPSGSAPGSSIIPPAFAMTPLPPPAIPSSPVFPRAPDHKKSTPELLKTKNSRTLSSALGKLPRRPSTAGATVGSSSSTFARPTSPHAPPLPPLPASPHATQPERREDTGTLQRAFPSETMQVPSSPRPDRTSGSHPHSSGVPRRPSTANGSHSHSHAPAMGVAMSTSTSSTTSYGSPVESSTLKKRATRKLSFTAPMLGFGRKDKERHKDQPPPSAFAAR